VNSLTFPRPIRFAVLLAALGCLFFAGRMVDIVSREGVNLPFSDEYWTFGTARTVLQSLDGTLTPAKVFNSHGGHRVVWTHLLAALHAPFTRWDVRFEMFFSVGLAFATLVILILMLLRTMPLVGVLVAAVPMAGFFFSLLQYENWFWAMETCWYFTNFFTILTVAYASRATPGLRSVILTLALATCALYSMTHGAFAFAGGAVALYVAGLRRWRLWVLYFVITGIMGLLYYSGDSGLFGGVASALPHRVTGGSTYAIAIARYVLAGIASFIYYDPKLNLDPGVLIGGLVLALSTYNLLWLWRHHPDRRMLGGLLGLGAFVLGSAVLIGLTRANPALINDPNVYQSRYATLWLLAWVLWVATSAAVVSMADVGRVRRIVTAALVVIVVGLFVRQELFTPPDRVRSHLRQGAQSRLYEYLLTERRQPLVGLAGDLNTLQRDVTTDTINGLFDRRLTLFADPPPPNGYTVRLVNAPLNILQDVETDIRNQTVNDVRHVSIFQHAPGLAEQVIHLPDLPTVRYEFRTGVYVRPRGNAADVTPPYDGVRFVVWVRGEGQTDFVQVGEAIYDDTFSAEQALPITVDLAPYQGQTITLRYETDMRGNPNYDWAVWLEPRVIILPSSRK
jgi:hypothetical protein